MLQWMGGSRRKVTTSRNSTHKRQKQYFEQRKRQQHQHSAGLESYPDGKRSCIKNNRSLDILSLVTVSTVAEESKISCLSEDKPEEYDFTLNHEYARPSHNILEDEALPLDQAEINEERTPSSYGTEAKYSEKASNHLPDHNEDLVGNGNKRDPFKLSTTLSDISVIDLLSDSGANINAEENSAHVQEAHVAFSIEGLGKVETDTPLHSPKILDRSFPIGFSTPKKARRQPITSKHTDFGFNELGNQLDVDFSAYYSSIEHIFCPEDTKNIIDDPKLMFTNRRCPSPFNWDGSNFQSASDNDEPMHNSCNSVGNIWDGPSFLDKNIDDLGDHDTSCKNRRNQRNVPTDEYEYFHNSDFWKQDFNLDGWNLQKKRFSTERTENMDRRGSPVPYSNHQTTLDLSDKFSNTSWHSVVRIDDNVKEAVNRFVREDNRESMSLLSEESCSSTAVRGDATRKS